ncbi:hypothetical protein, partial [Sporisorium scitamineum]
MTSLPYKTAEQMDVADIPLANMQTPRQQGASTESLSGPPPAHFLHHHRMDDPNYYQGLDAGNQAGYDQLRQRHNDNASPSGSGSNADSSNATKNGWDTNQDTLIDRTNRPTKIGLPTHHDVFEPPHAPFASSDAINDESEDFDWDTSSENDDDDDGDNR